MATLTHAKPGYLSPDDLLTAILALAEKESGGEPFRFRGHDSALQGIFRHLVERGGSTLLSSFVYSYSGPDPYCPALTEAVSRLQLAGLLGRENPDYEVILVRPAASKYFDHVLRHQLSEGEIEQLTQVARGFLRIVSEDR
jgi:hypothetical protein